MTPEEKLAMARQIVGRFIEGDSDNPMRVASANKYYEGRADTSDEIRIALLAIDRMQERVRAETERCAEIAETGLLAFSELWEIEIRDDTHRQIAAAIKETPHAEG